MTPSTSQPVASGSSSVQRAETALRGFQARQTAGSTALPQQPSLSLTQRCGTSQTAPLPNLLAPTREDGLLPRTRSQLPRWYITLRQLVLDTYRAVVLVYRIANHVLGSLLEVNLTHC